MPSFPICVVWYRTAAARGIQTEVFFVVGEDIKKYPSAARLQMELPVQQPSLLHLNPWPFVFSLCLVVFCSMNFHAYDVLRMRVVLGAAPWKRWSFARTFRDV